VRSANGSSGRPGAGPRAPGRSGTGLAANSGRLGSHRTAVRGGQGGEAAQARRQEGQAASGPAAGGTVVKIRGKNFVKVKKVLFGKTKGTRVRVT
jgi:hypothetical protein